MFTLSAILLLAGLALSLAAFRYLEGDCVRAVMQFVLNIIGSGR